MSLSTLSMPFQCQGTILSHEVLRGDNCYDITVEYEVTAADVFNKNTGKTCAQDPTWDIGQMLEICVRDVVPPPDNFKCDDGQELNGFVVGAGDNCYAVSVKYGVTFADIYNVANGLWCTQSDDWDVGEAIRICKRTVVQPPDNYVCNGVELNPHTVVSGDNCYALSIRYDVNYADIYNTNTKKTCNQSATLQIGDRLRICNPSKAVVA
jgi:LysM repeat protein